MRRQPAPAPCGRLASGEARNGRTSAKAEPMKTLPRIEWRGLVLVALLCPARAARPDGKDAQASTVLRFGPHPGCSGAAVELHVGAKVLRAHVCKGEPGAAFLELLHDFGMFL